MPKYALTAHRAPYGADTLVLESTYGDRRHPNRKERRQPESPRFSCGNGRFHHTFYIFLPFIAFCLSAHPKSDGQKNSDSNEGRHAFNGFS